MIDDGPTYRLPIPAGPIRQGEILSSVDQYIIQLNSQSTDATLNVQIKKHPYAVVLAQDCDLAQDFKGRFDDPSFAKKLCIPNVLLCEVDIAENLKNGGTVVEGSGMWNQIKQNKIERFQYLREVPAEMDAESIGIASLLIDFKRAFTLPTEMLYEEVRRNTKRRALLTSPYLQHLSSRYAYFISRVALPRDHNA